MRAGGLGILTVVAGPRLDRAAAIRRADALDLAAARAALLARGWLRYVVNEVELEYRRAQVLAALYGAGRIALAPLVAAFGEARGEPADDWLAPAGDDELGQTLALYEETFPGCDDGWWRTRLEALELPDPPRPAAPPPRIPLEPARDPGPLAEQLRRDGYVHLRDLFGPALRAALEEEARARQPDAVPLARDEYRSTEFGQVRGPRANRAAPPGPRLEAVHEDAGLVALLRELTGLALAPTRTGYLYYAAGDFMGLHTDGSPCGLTLLAAVLGPVGPLVLHPGLAGLATAELVALGSRARGLPDGGTPVAVPRDGVLVLPGARVPHHRPVVPAACAVANLCYAAVG